MQRDQHQQRLVLLRPGGGHGHRDPGGGAGGGARGGGSQQESQQAAASRGEALNGAIAVQHVPSKRTVYFQESTFVELRLYYCPHILPIYCVIT